MTLRAKLAISFTALLLLGIATVGLIASRSIQSILIDQIDQSLLNFADRGPGPRPGGSSSPPEEPFLRPFAELVIDSDGTVIHSSPSGFADDPDPLPDAGAVGDAVGLTFLPSVDGSLDYRANVEHDDDLTAVLAAPLSEVTEATTSLVRTLIWTGGLVVLLGAFATWWTVRRAMRPVDRMVETAEAIAAGDLTRRVPEVESGTELGRLGASLNEMLGHIQASLEREREGRDRLRRFIADASHELRTPITAISGYAELHRRGGLTTPELEQRAWERIEAESNRMGSLVEDLLTLARLGQTQPLEVEDVDLAEIVNDAVTDHRAIDPLRPVQVKGPDTVRLQADKARLHQVLTNLLANVRRHTPEGTLVEVTMVDAGDHVELRVADDGPGIPEEILERVFDRFYRADQSRSRASGGTGLGLAIVQAIVTAHGGTVSATKADQGGLAIQIKLPRTKETAHDA